MPRSAAAIRTSPVRATALLAIGALVLHELRYLIDPSADSTAWAGGHAYLSAVAPLLIVLALSLVAVTLLGPLLRLRRSGLRPAGDRTGGYALALLVVHLGQEATEGALAGASASALAVSLLAAAAFAIPLALALGGLTTLLAGWLERAEGRLAAALDSRPARSGASERVALASVVARALPDLTSAAGRGPPMSSPARS